MGTTTWQYNNSVDSIVVGVNTFAPQAGLSRGTITDGRDSLVVRLPGNHAFPQLFKTLSPSASVSLTIQWLDRDDNPGSLRILYKGWIKSVKFTDDGQFAELFVESIISGLEENMCDDQYCIGCQVVLYGTKCGLNKDDWDYSGVVSLVDGNDITVTGVSTAPRSGTWALPGMVKYGDEWRQIYKQVGDVLTLAMPFSVDVTGLTVIVYAGCDHTIATCEDVFDNAVNYRGHPYLPKQNVFLTGLQ